MGGGEKFFLPRPGRLEEHSVFGGSPAHSDVLRTVELERLQGGPANEEP